MRWVFALRQCAGIDADLRAGCDGCVVDEETRRGVDAVLTVAHGGRDAFAKERRFVLVVVEEVVWQVDAVQRVEDGLDHLVSEQPQVAAEHLTILLFSHLDASVGKFLPGEVAPPLKNAEPTLEVKRRAPVFGQRPYLRLVITWLRVAVLVRDDVFADDCAIEVGLREQTLQVLGGHEVFLPNVAQLLLVDGAHVREYLPHGNPLVVRPQAVRDVLHLPLARLRVRLVRLAGALFDEWPLQDASAIANRLRHHAVAALPVAHAPRKLDKLIVNRRDHRLARGQCQFLFEAFHVYRRGVFAGRREHVQGVLHGRLEDLGVRRGLQVPIALTIGREKQVHEPGLDGVALDLRQAQEQLRALRVNALQHFRIIAPLVLAQRLDPLVFIRLAQACGLFVFATQLLAKGVCR